MNRIKSAERRERAKKLYLETDLTLREIAEAIGVEWATVKRWSSQGRWRAEEKEFIEVVPVLPSDEELGLARESVQKKKRSVKRNQRASSVAGVVYFITTKDALFVKIGFSTKPQERVQALQTSSPVKLSLLAMIPGTMETERYFHELFSDYRTDGEWFRLEGDLMFAITLLKSDAFMQSVSKKSPAHAQLALDV